MVADHFECCGGPQHLVLRNFIGFILGSAAFVGNWLLFDPIYGWGYRTAVGLILAALIWTGVMCVSAKGH
jgi:hypothetical protein